tara:strand:+ start:9046 stop:9246 length:201 start_codon:yes stop_codon:yes gene_type:complete
MAEAERYGINVVASQIEDQITQEAFRDQERINAELRSKVIALSGEVANLREMIKEQSETLAVLMDG